MTFALGVGGQNSSIDCQALTPVHGKEGLSSLIKLDP